MKTQDEKKVIPSFDDLVFKDRNKEYGAYTMRKKYNAALMWSIIVSIFFISASVITPFVIYEKEPVVTAGPRDTVAVEFTDIQQIENQKIEQPKPQIEKSQRLDYSKPEIVDSLSPDDAKKFLTNDELNDKIKNDSVGDYVPETERPEVEPEPNDVINEVFSVNEKPLFGISGDNEFRSWIAQHIVYPQAAIDALIQGKVYLQFVVEKDGSISNIQVLRSIDPELSKEAVRVLELSPKWIPGKINGSPVRVKVSFPIIFSLKNN